MQSSLRMFEVILHKVVQSGPFLALDTFYWLTTTVHHINHDFGFIHACVPQPELFGAPLVNQLPFLLMVFGLLLLFIGFTSSFQC